MKLTLNEGKILIKTARKAILEYVDTEKEIAPPKDIPSILNEKRGVFVTLYKLHENEKQLRGCIGYPYPTLPLIIATIKAAINSATKDYRFYPPYGPGAVTSEEMRNIIIEISVLTPPELIKVTNPREYLDKIVIGRDGIIVERGMFSGLLLPQVPVEQNWNCEEFLSYCSQKAGLLADSWLDKDTKIYKFQAQIFAEKEPGGEILEKEAASC
ncbi:MAG: TIGR00296 family protein [Candidatus Odinarchaeia archaeon]